MIKCTLVWNHKTFVILLVDHLWTSVLCNNMILIIIFLRIIIHDRRFYVRYHKWWRNISFTLPLVNVIIHAAFCVKPLITLVACVCSLCWKMNFKVAFSIIFVTTVFLTDWTVVAASRFNKKFVDQILCALLHSWN